MLLRFRKAPGRPCGALGGASGGSGLERKQAIACIHSQMSIHAIYASLPAAEVFLAGEIIAPTCTRVCWGAAGPVAARHDLLLSLNLEYYAYGLVLMMGLQTALLGREALKRSKLIPQQNFTMDEAGKT